MVQPTAPLSATLSLLDAFAAANPGAITSIEGPNEIDFTPVTYNGLTGVAGAISFQTALFTAVHADTNLAGLPVLNFTDASATVAGQSDQSNVHVYPANGAQAYAALAASLAAQQSAMPGQAVALTELGYANANYNSGPSGPGGVDLITQAKLTLNAIMDATLLGFSQIDLYQLLDGAADPSGTDPQAHYGLFDNNGVAKPVANDIHILTSILADTGTNATTFTPGALSYSISNMPTTGNSYLIQKSSGVYDLVLWNEPQVWNATTDTEVSSPNPIVTVNFGATFGTVDLYDTMSGATPVYEAHNIDHMGVTLVDHPVIIEISTASTAAPIVNTPYSNTGPHIMFNADGSSYYVVSNTTDVINAPVGGATQTVQASCSYTLPANLTILALTGAANLTATGNNLNNIITANGGNDTLIGGSGNDQLFGGAGVDTLIGGAGSTIFTPGVGVATMIGGSGSNSFSVNNVADVVQAQAGAAGNTLYSSVSFTAPANVASFYLTGSANLTATANNGAINLFANSGNDTLIAGSGNDHLFAGAGVDSLIGGAGSTIFTPGVGVATMIGGSGSNSFSVNNVADVVQAQAGAAGNTLYSSVSFTAPANVASFYLTGSANLTATANSGTICLFANSGNDTLIAGAGADHLFAGAGADTLYGGAGSTIFTPGVGVATMIGGSGSNSFSVNNVADVVQAQAGAVNNTVYSSVSFTAPANVASFYLTGSANLTAHAVSSAINIFANSGNDTLIAGAGSDRLFAGAGADTLIGGAGSTNFTPGAGVATMIGGSGSNCFSVNNVADVVQAQAGAAGNTLYSSVSFTAPANVASFYLTGSANLTATANSGAINLFANSGNDTLIAGSGNDHLFAGAGADTLIGGAGSTLFTPGSGVATMIGGSGSNCFSVNNVADVVQAQAGAAGNTLYSSVSFTAPANVASFYLTGSANLTATANSGPINIFANSGADTLYGGSGATNLFGGAGGDTFIAGTGATMMTAGAGADKFVFQSVADMGTVSHPDIISGFTSGQDVVDLSAIAHAALGAGQSLTFLGTAAFTHVAGQVDYTLSSGGLTLQGDLNGDGVADFSLFLNHATAIAGHDLVLG